ncbi:MAG: hypothetical protein H6977_08945 [Gammaproteobacteria bacterium]|nr:hypothetical protein [Gammaproteobacteria bacterium]MCP5200129.1 hypothetical protein [Gammaproteobacteria bacterium]
MNTRLVSIALLGTLLTTPVASPAAQLTPDATLARHVALEAEYRPAGEVRGTLTNIGEQALGGIVLLVRHGWLWRDELHPGPDDPSWADYVSVDQRLEPGASTTFVYRPATPPPVRDDGRFTRDVEVVGATVYRYADPR